MMLDRQAIEKEIAELKSSPDAQSAIGYLSGLIDKYESREKAIREEIHKLQEELSVAESTTQSMRQVRLLLEAAQKSEATLRFTQDMPVWECAQIILHEEMRPLYSADIARRIETGGKILGHQASAKVTSGLSRHLDSKFTRKKVKGGYVYSLIDWGVSKNDLGI